MQTQDIITNLKKKLQRQEAAVAETRAHIALLEQAAAAELRGKK